MNSIKRLGVMAGGTTIVLTAVAFWLSYTNLHDTASSNGLSGARAWAWPSTVDMFIAVGELLVLRAALRRRRDWFAYTLTVLGSGASIVLNVAGVGVDASVLTHVVAAVPPIAALLAFAALMRQVYERLAVLEDSADTEVCTTPSPLPSTLSEAVDAVSPAPVPSVDTVSADEAKALIERGYRAGWSLRTTALACARSKSYVEKLYKELAAAGVPKGEKA